MNLRRTLVLLSHEIVRGPKNFLFIFAIIMPLIFTLVVSLLFGTLFSGKPRIGVVDAGNSQLVQLITSADYVITKPYESPAALRDATGRGIVDVGIVFPLEIDTLIRNDEEAELLVYVWGESLIKNRTAVLAVLGNAFIETTGKEAPIDIVTTTLGETEALPWEQRLFPFIVLVTLLLGAMMVPATSLVEEKQKRTLRAITITPTTLGDVFAAKGALGVLLSVVMAVIILVLNQAFGSQPGLLLFMLILGATMAAGAGVLLGAFMKDMNTLFATMKGLGIFLYAPTLVYMFPSVPQWVARIFPTYYIIAPIVEITQNGAGWSVIFDEVAILLLFIAVLIGMIGFVAYQSTRQDTIFAV